jgi:chromosome segregation protein
MLARARERRELPSQIAELQGQRQELFDAMNAAADQEASVQRQISALSAQLQDAEQERRSADQAYARIEQETVRIRRERDWHRSRAAEAVAQLAEMDDREAELRLQLSDLRARVSVVETEIAETQDRIERANDPEQDAQLADRRAELALTRQHQAGRQAELAGYQRSLRELEQRIAARDRRVSEIAAQSTQTERHTEQLRVQQTALSAEIQAYASRIEPAERELADTESQQTQCEEQESSARSRLQTLESRHNHSELDVARQEEHMNSLSRQIVDDLGPVDLDMGDDLSGQPYLPLTPLVSSLPAVELLPEGIEQQMNALKRRLHRLEPVNPTAPEEHAQVSKRYEFLSTQAHDLDQAMSQLREVIAELDAVMEREFKRSFDAIHREFRAYFDRLFRGGSARLELTAPDDLMSTGIEIVVRPPGKRQQGLALLSGGERALTTAALIFAILSVSPTPFCVLDEVDATLDEANVGRFRAVLKALSEETQFVVITHNRYTIEVADVVYGISMGTDGTSCVISHRLNVNGDSQQV